MAFLCPAGAKPIVWTIQTNNSLKKLRFSSRAAVFEEIKKETNGGFVINQLFVNKNSMSTFNKVKHNSTDGMIMTPQYWGAADPVFTIMGDLTAAWSDPLDYYYWLNNKNGIRFLEKAYKKHNMVLVSYSLNVNESLISTRPIRNVADFKGLVMRAPKGMVSEFFTKLGVNVRSIDVAKVYSSFTTGIISVTDYSNIQTNLTEGFYNIAKHTNYPGFHSMPLVDFVVNEKLWNELPSKYKQLLKKKMKKWSYDQILLSKVYAMAAVAKVKAKGVMVYRWKNKDLLEARSIAVDVWDEFSKKSPDAKEVVSEIKKFLKIKKRLLY